MRTFTVEHTVYKFDELSDEAKKRAIKDYHAHEWEQGLGWLEDDMRYRLDELFEEYGITDKGTKLRYSLSYNQGDGASFSGEIEWKAWRATIGGSGYIHHHYMHWNSVNVTEMTSLKTDKEAPDATVEKLDDIVHEIGKKLERYGYDAIESYLSDENISSLLRDNEYEFYSDGRMA